jgi:hypothetical protein
MERDVTYYTYLGIDANGDHNFRLVTNGIGLTQQFSSDTHTIEQLIIYCEGCGFVQNPN